MASGFVSLTLVEDEAARGFVALTLVEDEEASGFVALTLVEDEEARDSWDAPVDPTAGLESALALLTVAVLVEPVAVDLVDCCQDAHGALEVSARDTGLASCLLVSTLSVFAGGTVMGTLRAPS